MSLPIANDFFLLMLMDTHTARHIERREDSRCPIVNTIPI
jgi:hypothetical protein